MSLFYYLISQKIVKHPAKMGLSNYLLVGLLFRLVLVGAFVVEIYFPLALLKGKFLKKTKLN